jgi:hypothetical protein
MPLDPAQVELAVFLAVTDLHPVHLTLDGLVLEVSGGRDEGEKIRNAISELKACGLLEASIDNLIAPTRAARKAHELLAP